MIITEQTQVRYVPRINGNADAKKEERVVVVLQLPTALERNTWRRFIARPSLSTTVGVEIEQDTEKVIQSCVLSIEGLRIAQPKGTAKQIRTASELLASRSVMAGELVQELATVLLQADSVPEEEEKK